MKKMRAILKLLLTCLIVFLIFSLASCGENQEIPNGYIRNGDIIKNDNATAMVLILGKHANAMEIPDDAYKQIEKLLDNTVYGGYICAVIVDSNPTKVELVDDKDFFVENAKNTTALYKRINFRTAKIINLLNELNVVADSEEVDLLASIREAINVLSSDQASNAKIKKIVIIDTGISTTGDLNFCDLDFLYGKPDIDEIIKQLKDYEGVGVLPDLTGVDVTFIGTADGLAEVAEPQELTTTDKKFIKNLWSSVVKACGANSINYEIAAGWSIPNTYSEDNESIFKYVSVVPFFHNKVIDISNLTSYDPNNPDQQPGLPSPPEPIEFVLKSQTIGFEKDTANYVNVENAKKVLRPYAEELKEFFNVYPDEKIWIVGTTAEVIKGNRDGYDLSLKRAEAVKKTLEEFGIKSDNLQTIGVGCVFPWKADEFPNGIWDTNIAQDNRTVVLFSTSDNADSDSTNYFMKLKHAYDNNELLPETISRFELLYNLDGGDM